MPLARLIFIFIPFFIFSSIVHAEEKLKWDSTTWNRMSQSQQSLYILGLLEGLNFGRWDVRLALVQKARDHHPKGVESELLENWAIDFSAEDYNKKNANNISAAQVVSGITELYKDYRNRQIPIVSIADVAIESITGTSKEQIEERLLNMRIEISKK